jgi:hypothetical protein
MDPDTGRKPRNAMVLWCFLLAVLLAWGGQWALGAHRADLSAHPDEAAHFVTGLMVRDYIARVAGGDFDSPVAYARRYYEALPRVALGHYPPGFYLLEAVWLLPDPHISAALLLQAALAAALSAFVFRAARPAAGVPVAFGAALALQALPWLRQLNLLVMSDLLVCLLALAAGGAWQRFLTRPSGRMAGLFGLLAAAAILTKGTALFLALVPVLTLIAGRRWDLLRRPALYLAPVPVVLLAAPWMIATYGITQEGMSDAGFLDYLSGAIPEYFKAGWQVLVPVLAGTAVCLFPGPSASQGRFWALFGLSNVLFTLAVPSGIDARYLLPAAVGWTISAALGLARLAGAHGRGPRLAALALPVATLACWLLVPVSPKLPAGFASAAKIVGTKPGTALIISDARGEGAFIAEIAQRERRPDRKVLRSSKEMAASDWLGRGYEAHVQTSDQLDALLRERRVEWVVVDRSVAAPHQKQHHLLGVAWAERPVRSDVTTWNLPASTAGFRPGGEATGATRHLTVLRLEPPPPGR